MMKFMFSQNSKILDEIFQICLYVGLLIRQRKTGRFCQITVTFFENLNFDIVSIPVLLSDVGEGPLTHPPQFRRPCGRTAEVCQQ